MFSQEEPQIKILMFKEDLDETKNNIVSQTGVLHSLDEENEQFNEENRNLLQEYHNLNAEIENLKLENVRLSAKKIVITRRYEDATVRLNRADENRNIILQQINDELADVESMTRKYEDHLSEIAERYRKTPLFACKAAMTIEKEQMTALLTELKTEEAKQQNIAEQLQRELGNAMTSVPDEILDIVGKRDLEVKIKGINTEVVTLTQKMDHLFNGRNIALFE